MKCPECQSVTRTLESRAVSSYKRRKRRCMACGHRFLTYEFATGDLEKSFQLTIDVGFAQGQFKAKAVVK